MAEKKAPVDSHSTDDILIQTPSKPWMEFAELFGWRNVLCRVFLLERIYNSLSKSKASNLYYSFLMSQ